MATTNETARSYAEVKRELAREIKKHREDCVPIEAARQLLSYDHPEHELVGIGREAERVVYYDVANETAFACPFSDVGPDGDRGVGIALLEPPVSIDVWIAKMVPYWDWVHPRFRTDGI